MPCSDQHFIPILDELQMLEDQKNQKISENPCPSVAKKGSGWGGRRPGAGAPKGNLNALKHGRTSRRQAQLLEALMEVPQVRYFLIDLAKRNRRLRKQAEEGFGVLMTRLLERVAGIVLNQDNVQDQNNQEFLDFLNTTTAQMRKILEKPSRHRRTTIRRPPTANS